MTKDTNVTKKMIINKIFSGFFHNYAISTENDYFCWGNPKGYRLSKKCLVENFDVPLVFPPLGDNSGSNGHEGQDEKGDLNTSMLNVSRNQSMMGNNSTSKNAELEERKIFEMINDNNGLDFNTLVNLIKNLSDKYDDDKLDEQDQMIENSIRKALEKLYVNKDYDDNFAMNYFEYEKLLNYRIIKDLRPYFEPCSWVEGFFAKKNNLVNLNEIQVIYNLFFLHPCIFRDFFAADDDVENFILTKDLMRGFQPLFKEMNNYSKRCISMENVIYLNFFNMLLDVWISKISKIPTINAENVFDNDNSFLADFLEIYFYDEFRKSILYDIFEKGLRDLNILAKNKKQISSKPGEKSEESLKISNLLNVFEYSRKSQDEKGIKVNLINLLFKV